MAHQAAKGGYDPAATMARRGLALADDADIAWSLASVLAHDGKVQQARETLSRYHPRPTTEDEARLWLQLHLGEPFSTDDAWVLVELVRQQPEGGVRDMAAALLLREVLLRVYAMLVRA
jgi:hypothetical protein